MPTNSDADPLPWSTAASEESPSAVRLRDASSERDVIRLYDQHAAALARYVIGATGNPDLAAEVVQECFLRYVSHRSAGGTEASSRTWLFREVRDQIRRHVRLREAESGRSAGHAAASSVADPALDPEQACLTEEMLRIVRSVAAPREMECILLRAEGLEYEEIAEVMKIATGTVGATLARVVRKMQAAVRKGGPA